MAAMAVILHSLGDCQCSNAVIINPYCDLAKEIEQNSSSTYY